MADAPVPVGPKFPITTSETASIDLQQLANALWPLLEPRVVASFPGQKSTGPALPNQVLGLTAVVVGAGSSPGAPTNLLMSLIKQNSSNSTPSPPTPPLPNQQRLIWDSYPGASSFNIYRTAANGSTFSLYDTSATNSYTDLAATLCVSGTAGAGPEYYVANIYLYKVSAMVSGLESALSATQSCILYANGVQDHIGGDFNVSCTSDYANATGAPLGGHTLCLKNTITAAFGDWLPWVGNNATQWNLPVGAYTKLRIDVKAMQSPAALTLRALRVGDVQIQAQGGGPLDVPLGNYATFVNGSWVTFIVPLVDLLTDWTSGSPVLQRAFYKTNVSEQTGNTGGIYFIDNMILTP